MIKHACIIMHILFQGPRIQSLGSKDVKLFQREQQKLERESKRARYHENLSASTSEARLEFAYFLHYKYHNRLTMLPRRLKA